jgi:hypothetical protein
MKIEVRLINGNGVETPVNAIPWYASIPAHLSTIMYDPTGEGTMTLMVMIP